MKKIYSILIFLLIGNISIGQIVSKTMLRLPDTGQNTSYTATFGEDNDYSINTPFFINNGNGTVTDTITGLMWQKADGGEMTIENAYLYCDTLTLGGYSDWRLPTPHEAFSILNHQYANPSIDITVFTTSAAEYWWTIKHQPNDTTKVWATNAGGGIGNHPKTETISAGGTKHFHVRAVRNRLTSVPIVNHFTDNGNGTITDILTNLVWQKVPYKDSLTWEDALKYADTLTLAGVSKWRLPNIKELQSINDEGLINPSVNTIFFTNIGVKKYWTSTTLPNQTTKAWYMETQYGVTTYDNKTSKLSVFCVRGGNVKTDVSITDIPIPAGQFDMGDHFGFVDPNHPSDEMPIHSVKVNATYFAKTETTNLQFLAFLNSSLLNGLIEVRNNIVYATGDTNIYCYTNQFATYYSIGFDGKVFSITDFRTNHPLVGVMWFGAAAFCNWMSLQNGLQDCYNLKTWDCDFTKTGYRLPTEAEWEWAGRGGHISPYYNYPWGNDVDKTKANWDNSGDPYEGTLATTYPYTTPVGFYDGSLRLKSDYNWPGTAASYQTGNGANSYGLYDMAGNVWEFVNDWYGQSYYSSSPTDNPKGPTAGFIMPDGKPYRGMRGGNWYNGDIVSGVSDGHSRVSNRNPSYYRGPQDPNHPWYHIGFRVARNNNNPSTGMNEQKINTANILWEQNFPNPFSAKTTIQFKLLQSSYVVMDIYNSRGQLVDELVNDKLEGGLHSFEWNAYNCYSGIYYLQIHTDDKVLTEKIILIK